MADPVSAPTSFLSRSGRSMGLFRKSRNRAPSQVTALDIDGQTLRLVQIIPKGERTEITRLLATPLDFPADADRTDPNVVGRAIAKALTELKLKPGSVVMGVPRAQVVLRTLVLPLLSDLRELASMVHFQIGRDLPFRMDEAVIDFKVRRQITPPPPRVEGGGEAKPEVAPSPKLEVLVAALKREVVDFYQQLTEVAGLRLTGLGLLPYANARCVEACQVADGRQAFALVSLRPDEVNIDVIGEQALLFSRGATFKLPSEPALPAPFDAPGAEKPDPALVSAATAVGVPPEPPKTDYFIDAVTIEVVRSLHGFSGMEPDSPVAKVVVTGATGSESAVVEALTRRLSRPCALLDPAGAFRLSGEARDHANGAIAAIGLALGQGDPGGLPFDFLNPKRPAVQRDLRRIRILAGVAAAAAILVFVLAIRTYLINQRMAINRNAAAELAEAEKNRPIYKRMIQQAAVTEEWVKGGQNWLEHYAYLSAILPPSEEIYITSLTVTGQGVIRLSVQARSGETLAKLDKQLRAAGYDVKPVAITPGADRYGYEFRSNVELTVPEKLKIDLAKVRPPARPADDGSLDPKLHRAGGGG